MAVPKVVCNNMAKHSAHNDDDDDNCWPRGYHTQDNPGGANYLFRLLFPVSEGSESTFCNYMKHLTMLYEQQSIQLHNSLSKVVTLSLGHGAKCMTKSSGM
jgi:hypothetical protein